MSLISLNFVNWSILWAFWPLCRLERVTQKRERKIEEVFYLLEAADHQSYCGSPSHFFWWNALVMCNGLLDIPCSLSFGNWSILWLFWPLCRLERVTRKRERKREEVFFLFRGRRPSKLLRRPYTAFSRHTHTLTLSTVKHFILFF